MMVTHVMCMCVCVYLDAVLIAGRLLVQERLHADELRHRVGVRVQRRRVVRRRQVLRHVTTRHHTSQHVILQAILAPILIFFFLSCLSKQTSAWYYEYRRTLSPCKGQSYLLIFRNPNTRILFPQTRSSVF